MKLNRKGLRMNSDWIFSELNYILNGIPDDLKTEYQNKYEDKLRVFTDTHDNIYWTGNEEEKILEIHLPGYSKDDVEVSVCGNEMAVSWGIGTGDKVCDRGGNYTCKIPKYYEYPETAEMKHGIFTMKFKKKQEETFNIEVV